MSARYELHAAHYAADTVSRYEGGVQDFTDWLADRGVRFPRRTLVLDQLLCDFTHYVYRLHNRTGAGKSRALYAVYGLIMQQPRLRKRLIMATRALSGWDVLHPAVHSQPLSWSLTCMLAAVMLKQGWWGAAAATIVGFDCYCRPGELLRIRRSQVLLPGDLRVGSHSLGAALSLKYTKTGPYQWVHVRRKVVGDLLRLVVSVSRYRGWRTLFGLSKQAYSSRFKRACELSGLQGFTPRCLRAGGSTTDCLDGHHINDIVYRGRWRRQDTAKSYIQTGRGVLLENNYPELSLYGERVGGTMVDGVLVGGCLLELFRLTQFR